ncbi:hypothetical protein EBH_0035810 [Eimeria brunetti]|uniref:Uncharacterized protein n=1 Tax=Eimeria brunetti TaxID=51314 RepID=U6LN84_9EIME|nr:hypothetical protein EBH_0035810 [Eimeria brunetti]
MLWDASLVFCAIERLSRAVKKSVCIPPDGTADRWKERRRDGTSGPIRYGMRRCGVNVARQRTCAGQRDAIQLIEAFVRICTSSGFICGERSRRECVFVGKCQRAAVVRVRMWRYLVWEEVLEVLMLVKDWAVVLYCASCSEWSMCRAFILMVYRDMRVWLKRTRSSFDMKRVVVVVRVSVRSVRGRLFSMSTNYVYANGYRRQEQRAVSISGWNRSSRRQCVFVGSCLGDAVVWRLERRAVAISEWNSTAFRGASGRAGGTSSRDDWLV